MIKEIKRGDVSVAKRKDGYLNTDGGSLYKFAQLPGNIHITHSAYDSRLLPHYHDFVEIFCITEGEGVHRIGSESFGVKRGDLFLIDKGVSHSFFAKDESLCWINCIFRPEALEGGAGSAKELFHLRSGGALPFYSGSFVNNLRCPGDDIVAIFTDMLREYDRKAHGYEDILLNYLEIILRKIERRLRSESEAPSAKAKTHPAFDGIMAEVEAAPSLEYKEKELAERLYMSPAAFSAGFKRYAGVSFSGFLCSVRIKEAIRLLQEEDIPISAVQALAGYRDSKSFYRAFKRYTGTTPSNYRNKH